jgi:stage II sporulation protein D
MSGTQSIGKLLVIAGLLLACAWIAAFLPLSAAFAETTIKVLLLDSKYPRIPQKNEKLERLGNAKGEVLLSGLKYSGSIDVWKGEGGLYIINELPIEEYIKGVVAAEVGNKWDTEALKAQAVAARTFAINQKQSSGPAKAPFHLTSSVLHQAYKGGGIPDNIAKAVEDTRGEILTYEGHPIAAYYHSTSGGMTEDAEEVFGKSYPYLKPVETNCELSPYFMWEKKVPAQDIEKAVSMGELRDITIDSYTVSNRVRNFRFTTETSEKLVPAKDLRRLLGWEKLPSTMITGLVKDGPAFIFEGRGYGHGVGMCQWSALGMAREGKSYREILSIFYPGATIELYEDR